ncbi:hypothetical protein HMPREF9120_01238 [Neisseria sp. oral taxon 020 str. F0370]|nr:hypothetical protein HMPREF9120_01238 [Neisseria sp. oral taxon 020 str. F0370]
MGFLRRLETAFGNNLVISIFQRVVFIFFCSIQMFPVFCFYPVWVLPLHRITNGVFLLYTS